MIDHWTYAICSDGDLQEGIASEAASLAGHLRLGKLVLLYDDNHIQLDGPTAMAFSEDVLERFDAYGWHTQRVEDGNDVAAIEAAIDAARADERPSRSSPSGPTSASASPTQAGHARRPTARRSARTRSALHEGGLRLGPGPSTSTCRTRRWRCSVEPSRTASTSSHDWEERVRRYAAAFPAEAAELRRRLAAELPDGWEASLPAYAVGDDVATRKASQEAIQALAAALPELFGGSADLSESNLTDIAGGGGLRAPTDQPGGISASASASTPWAPSSTASPTTAASCPTARRSSPSATTCAARSGSRRWPACTSSMSGRTTRSASARTARRTSRSSTYAALRAIPNLWFVRPGDANEAVAAWALAVERADGPTALALTRQKLPDLRRHGRARPRGSPAGRLRPAAGLVRGRGREAGR